MIDWLFAINYQNALKRGWGGKNSAVFNAFAYTTVDICFFLTPIIFHSLNSLDFFKPSVSLMTALNLVFPGSLIISLLIVYVLYYHNKRYNNIITKKKQFKWIDWVGLILLNLLAIFCVVYSWSWIGYYKDIGVLK